MSNLPPAKIQATGAPPSPPKVPAPWEACWDEDSQSYYFWNTESNETSWDIPKANPAPPSSIHNPSSAEHIPSEYTGYYSSLPALPSNETPAKFHSESPIESVASSTPAHPYTTPYAATHASSAQFPDPYSYRDPSAYAGPSSYSTPHYQGYPPYPPTGDYAVKGFFNSKTGRFQPMDDNPSVASQYLDPHSHFSDYSKSVRQCSNFFDYTAWESEQGVMTKAKRHQKLSRKDIEKLKKARKMKKEMAKRKWLIEN